MSKERRGAIDRHITLRPVAHRETIGKSNFRSSEKRDQVLAYSGTFTFAELGDIARFVGVENASFPTRLLPLSLLEQVQKEYKKTGNALVGLESIYSAIRFYEQCIERNNVVLQQKSEGVYEWLELPELHWNNTDALRSLGFLAPISSEFPENIITPVFVAQGEKVYQMKTYNPESTFYERNKKGFITPEFVFNKLAFRVDNMLEIGFLNQLAWKEYVMKIIGNELQFAVSKNVLDENSVEHERQRALFLELLLQKMKDMVFVFPGTILAQQKRADNDKGLEIENTLEPEFGPEKARVYASLEDFLAQN